MPPRRSQGTDFGFRGIRKPPKTGGYFGADSKKQLERPLTDERQFRLPTGSKEFGLRSEYDYTSLWARWRRGYAYYNYGQQTFKGIEYSFQYYYSGVSLIGPSIPGYLFMYPTVKNDNRMWGVFIRPRNTFNFLDYNLPIVFVGDYDANTYEVRFSSFFNLPITSFVGEVLSNRYSSDQEERLSGFNNYTVVGLGVDGVLDPNPDYTANYNTIFLGHTESNSWAVVTPTTLAVPASGPPVVGEYLTTELQAQCSCPDFTAREGVNLYTNNRKDRYPYTKPQNMKPGFFDTGSQSSGPRLSNSIDDPGWARSFGFIYLNDIYNIASYTEKSYGDPSVLFYQPRWCKHIYASMWYLKENLSQGDAVDFWLPQPNDEPINGAYREMFEKNLTKQVAFLKRERDYRWWLRYGPSREELPEHVLDPDLYSVFVKTIGYGNVASATAATASGLSFFTTNEFNPFINPSGVVLYDGGTYASGLRNPGGVSGVLDGVTYASGRTNPSISFTVNGGVF